MRTSAVLLLAFVVAACSHKQNLEEGAVRWFCDRQPKDPGVQVARRSTVGLYECRVAGEPVYLGERDAGCDGEHQATELRLVGIAPEPDQVWVEEYMIPSCLAYDRDWLLGKDLLQKSGQGFKSLRTITY